MAFWNWSKTAADNDDADSTINAREGWAPSVVNNSLRSLMAALAKWRDDFLGTITTTGNSTAYEASSNSVLTQLTDGFGITLKMHATSGATPSLSVDSLTAKPIQSVAGTAIPTGALLINGFYTFVYNASADAWIVHGRFGDMLTSAGNQDLVAIEALSGTSGALKKTAANTWALDNLTTDIVFVKDGGGNVLQTGVLGEGMVDFDCIITGVTMLADQSGSAVVDIWKDTYANYPPTNDDSITASAPPTISTATKSQDTTLSGWTTTIAAGSILRYNLDSATSITRLTVILRVKRYT